MSSTDTDRLLLLAAAGDAHAVEAVFNRFRPRVERLVKIHFDSRLAGRLDVSDVVQDTLLEAHRRLPRYLEKPSVQFHVWLRGLAKERLIDLQRRHIYTQRRSVLKEELAQPRLSDDSVCALFRYLPLSETSPSQQLAQREMAERVRRALERLSEVDRETLVLRYLERVSVKEASETLGITENAFTKRHIRAIMHLRNSLEE